MLTRTLFLGNIEEMKKHTQQMDGPIHLVDSLLIKDKARTSVTRRLMKRFGALLMQIKIPYHGNTEETKKLIQPTDGPTHLADSLLTRRRTFLTRRLMKKFGDSSTLTKIPYLGSTEEMRRLTQLMDGLTHQADLLSIRRRISLTRRSMRKYGDSLMTTRIPYHGNKEETKRLIQIMDG